MRTSQFILTTLKEIPSEAEIISQKLMLKAGFIRRLAAGIYSWLPWGLKSLRKIENIVREEMNRTGATEILMPSVQPAELWKESGRWEKYGPELLRFKDRHERDFCLGPTHEEVITDIARRDIQSFRQLPRHYYQTQWKFRDEVRPRFGIMRGREFLMKDSYSFHTDVEDLKREYEKMYLVYSKIFTRLGLEFRAVAADSGSIGGNFTHEFHVLADSGEDIIAYSSESGYAANIQMAEAVPPPAAPAEVAVTKQLIATPRVTTCEAVADFLHLPTAKILKTLAVMAGNTLWLLLLRGDHSLNDIKIRRLPELADFRLATDIEIIERLGCPPGFLGPIGLMNSEKIKVLADHSALAMQNFACGANQKDHHFIGVNWQRDVPPPTAADLRCVLAGDPSPDGKGILKLRRGIEVGQIFQLGDKYSAPMNCRYLDQTGKSQVMQMGCYGIGVSRILGAAIEQGHDDNGMILPQSIAPFSVAIAPMGFHKSEQVRKTAEELYASLLALHIDVVLDDRDERPGVMLADLELVGIPHRLTVGEKSLKDGMVEYQLRGSKEPVERWPLSKAVTQLQARRANHSDSQPQV